MSKTDLTEHPLKVFHRLKDKLKNIEREDKFSLYLVENVIKACDELYQYCLMYKDPALCQEMVIFLQSVAYDFVALNEWFKLKTVCKDLPPPVRTSVSPSRASHNLKKLSRNHSVRRAKSEPRLNKPHSTSKEEKNRNIPKLAGVNVSAPDFIPTYSSKCEIESSWNGYVQESERNSYNNLTIQPNIDTKSGFQNQLYSNSSGNYHEEDRPVNSLVNLSYTQNVMPPNFWQYSTQINLNPFQHPTLQIPPHYVPHVPHFHLPYSLYTNTMGAGNIYPVGPVGNVITEQMQCSVNSGMNHSFSYSMNEPSLPQIYIYKNEQSEDIRPPSSLSDDSDIVIICNKTSHVSLSDKNENNGDILSTPDISSTQNLDVGSLPLLASEKDGNSFDASNNTNESQVTATNSFNISKENNENIINTDTITPRENTNESSAITNSSFSGEINDSQSNIILGLREDESQIHFPELKPVASQSRQKFRHKNVSKVTYNKPSFEMTFSVNFAKICNSKSNNKVISENNSEEKSSFSKLFKTSPINEQQSIQTLSDNNRKKAKSTSSQLYSTPSKQNHVKIIKEMGQKTNLEYSSYLNDENSDSDGWETVKVRSKWRDQTDFKHSRTGIRHYGKSFHDSKPVHYNSNPSSIQRSCAENSTVRVVKLSGSDKEQLAAKTLEDRASRVKHRNFQGGNITEKTIDVDKCIKKGRRNSSNYVRKSIDNSEIKQSGTTFYSDKTEKIDPNEMYSVYMQYINNVDEDIEDMESKHDKSILHPDAGEEAPHCVASLEQITDFVNRDPVRALEFKKKLADEIKHQEDVKQRNEVKQQLAQKKRLEFLQCKTAKVREFVQKVKEVKAAQHQLALQRKSRIDLKLKKAEEKRNLHLSIIKRKAHDEEEKLKEIAFINELEAQNRRHDSLALRQEHEERLQCLVEERQRRLEEKAAREAAVEERRRVLEAERQEKLEKMKEKRRRKQEIIDRKQQEREQERLESAREKAREREERLQARQSAQLATVEELQKRIQQKQEQSARRHGECIELIRQKAVEIGLHRNTIENVQNCNICKPEDQLRTEVSNRNCDTPENHKIHQKKRLKKIKARMALKGGKFIESLILPENVLPSKDQQLQKLLGKLQSYTPHRIYLWQDEECMNIDYALNEILTELKSGPAMSDSFRLLKGYTLINSIIYTFNNCAHNTLSTTALKCVIKVINLCKATCIGNLENCQYIVLSNTIVTLLDSLKHSIKILYTSNKYWKLLTDSLLKLNSTALASVNNITDDQINSIPDFPLRMKDLICYIMYSGLVSVTVDLFRATEIDEKFTHSSLILPCITYFESLLSKRVLLGLNPREYCVLTNIQFASKNKFKTDELMNTLKITDLFGTVPFLYEGLMQHLSKDGSLPDYSLPIINLFLKLANLDLKLFQDILGSEGIALQWRGIASGLMMLCVRKKYFGELLHSVIKTVGYFAINNKKNQTLIQSGKHPTVLQQLVKLPFQYFCDPHHKELLFPTLIACSFQNGTNKAIVENELKYSVLENFISSAAGKQNKLITLLLEHKDTSADVS